MYSVQYRMVRGGVEGGGGVWYDPPNTADCRYTQPTNQPKNNHECVGAERREREGAGAERKVERLGGVGEGVSGGAGNKAGRGWAGVLGGVWSERREE